MGRSSMGAAVPSPAGAPPCCRMTLTRALASELVRLRRSPLMPLHLVLGLGLGLAAGLYFGLTPWDSLLGTDAFFQLLGAGAPLLVGISCGLSIEAEHEAGEAVNLLGVPSRRVAVAAKGAALLLVGSGAAALAAATFAGVMAACGRALPDAGALMTAALCVSAGSVGLYALGLAVALRWGRNAAIGLGAVGFLVALASLGGLANGLVTGTLSGGFAAQLTAWIPFTWPARLASLAVELSLAAGGPQAAELVQAAQVVAVTCAVMTAVGVAVGLAAVNRFEDRRRSGD